MANEPVSCADIEDALKSMRDVDDKIIYELNLATPCKSFQDKLDPREHCKDLHQMLQNSYSTRDGMIRNCLGLSTERLRFLKEQRLERKDDSKFMKKFRLEQNQVRSLQNELTIEEIIKNRSQKVFYEKCKCFYKPPE